MNDTTLASLPEVVAVGDLDSLACCGQPLKQPTRSAVDDLELLFVACPACHCSAGTGWQTVPATATVRHCATHQPAND
ncbi:hypothetical protein KV557_24525 [Kitasatospora aureofaciens]|uniref:hypothetical protein n=1 Tax=Kitasatospora aureofaciens TaxID=1894 RepID=UPI001C47B876|nr:hypothetical protein [Kitasatospora aureofaciens]MBV6700230.1 hypothetical protein [Kitasatospora aureofaciens]